MGRKINAIRRVHKRYNKSPEFRAKFVYTMICDRGESIDDNKVLFQSFDGNRLGGNPFYILQEMEKDGQLRGLRKIIAVKSNAIDKTRLLIQTHEFTNCDVVELHSEEYCKHLATSKFLVNNSTFPTYFIKREGQRYLNTWHGTPLKSMGRRITDKPWGTGNTQRNFLMADYLLYPNRYTYDHFVEDYMIGQYYTGKYVLGGYPCNSVFFDDERRERIREELGLEGKKIVAYLPTWRVAQKNGHGNKHQKMSEFVLMNLDEHLDEDTVVFAQLHYYDSRKAVNLSRYKKVKDFPKEYETYEILNMADVLITDYSSVMFDCLNLNKEIVLFDYDKEEYFSTRGTYFNVDDLPFWRTKDSYELCSYINEIDANARVEYPKEQSLFCGYDSLNSAKSACDLLFYGDESNFDVIDGVSLHNNKKNILIFAGALTKNGLTSALQGLLENVDYDRANILLTFKSKHVKNSTAFFKELDSRICYLPMQGSMPMTHAEALARFGYYRQNSNNKHVQKLIDEMFEREARRCFPSMQFDTVMHFTGYERDMVHVLLGCKAANRVMYVHSDMVQEKELKGNFHVASIEQAYSQFDRIAVVRDGLVDVMADGFNIPREKIAVVHNVNKIKQIREGSMRPVQFDEDTFCSIELEHLNELLNDSNLTKFISIGRFSPEKGLPRLVSSFGRFADEDKNSVLIIIGGHGVQFDEVYEAASEVGLDRVVIIKSLSNPFPVLAKADAFVMSSLYEGLPMSIIEALILGKPVICTDIPGPREFLEQGYGYIVPNSEEGLYQGFCDFRKGLVNGLKPFDADAFNRKALEEFYAVAEL